MDRPTVVYELTDKYIVQISVGALHCLALTNNGEVHGGIMIIKTSYVKMCKILILDSLSLSLSLSNECDHFFFFFYYYYFNRFIHGETMTLASLVLAT